MLRKNKLNIIYNIFFSKTLCISIQNYIIKAILEHKVNVSINLHESALPKISTLIMQITIQSNSDGKLSSSQTQMANYHPVKLR